LVSPRGFDQKTQGGPQKPHRKETPETLKSRGKKEDLLCAAGNALELFPGKQQGRRELGGKRRAVEETGVRKQGKFSTEQGYLSTNKTPAAKTPTFFGVREEKTKRGKKVKGEGSGNHLGDQKVCGGSHLWGG